MSTVVSSSSSTTSADAARVPMPLLAHPPGRVCVPLVIAILDASERFEDLIPAALVVQYPLDRLRDERAAPTPSDPAVELGDEAVVEAYV